ncbi:hypothetical protein S40288_01859 [Stachybotrys chartarum IBT 40288]|nr:hypothetical protein S40288_01859 [Stachybotrys chartarum IBT 40288]
MAPDPKSLADLEAVVETAKKLLEQLQVFLREIHESPSTAPTTPLPPAIKPSASTPEPTPFSIASDSAALIKAHATKLSLLIMNEPFTPSAIMTVVRDLVAGPIPGLASSVQATDAKVHTVLVRKELAWRARRVFAELGEMMRAIPTDGKALPPSKVQGAAGDGRGSLMVTAVLWKACDDVITVGKQGVAGYLLNQLEQWKELLKDTMDEMKEWGEEEAQDDEDDDDDYDNDNEPENLSDGEDDDGDENSIAQHQAMLDSLMDSHSVIPADDPNNIRPRLETSIKRLRLVILLFQAIAKRRVKKLPATLSANMPERIDEVAKVLSKLPDRFGDLAIAFYDLETGPIDRAMDACFFDAFAVCELLSRDWYGGRDEFSEWADRFRLEIKKD